MMRYDAHLWYATTTLVQVCIHCQWSLTYLLGLVLTWSQVTRFKRVIPSNMVIFSWSWRLVKRAHAPAHDFSDPVVTEHNGNQRGPSWAGRDDLDDLDLMSHSSWFDIGYACFAFICTVWFKQDVMYFCITEPFSRLRHCVLPFVIVPALKGRYHFSQGQSCV